MQIPTGKFCNVVKTSFCRRLQDIEVEAILQSNAKSKVFVGSCQRSSTRFVVKSYHKKAMTADDCEKVIHTDGVFT